MKYLFILIVLASCTKADVSPIGCQTGVSSRGYREIYRCATAAQAAAGWNVSAGGTDAAKYFTQSAWCACDCPPLKALQDTDAVGGLFVSGKLVECIFQSQASMEIARLKLNGAAWQLCIDCHK